MNTHDTVTLIIGTVIATALVTTIILGLLLNGKK